MPKTCYRYIRKQDISAILIELAFYGNPRHFASFKCKQVQAISIPKPYKQMTRQISFLAMFLLTNAVYGQKTNLAKTPTPPPTKKEMKADGGNCIRKNALSFSDRLKNYPFNLTAQIQFVSFENGIYLTDNEILRQDSLPRILDTILYSRLKEVKTLTLTQVNKLTDLFYNHGFRGTTYSMNEAACYNPRNAILFLDSKGKIIELIEICFECRKTSQSSDRITLGEMCEQKLDMLFGLFKNAGIEYGITNGVLPGG